MERIEMELSRGIGGPLSRIQNWRELEDESDSPNSFNWLRFIVIYITP